jgi:hypothetical protein
MTTKGSGSVRDSLVGLIVPGLLMTALVGVLVVKWRPAQATEPAPLSAAWRRGGELEASKQALRTGTRERSILYHAAAIHRAAGDMATARMLIAQAVDSHPEFDPIEGPPRALAKALSTK